MRIHTSLSFRQMYELAKASGAPVEFETLSQHKSRTHDRAFEVNLSGSSTSRSQKGDYQAATWDEWGAFLGALYDADPNARCGRSTKYPVYRDAEHYHLSTRDRFHKHRIMASAESSYLPRDTHPRHQWIYRSEDGFACTKCSATRPTASQRAEAYAPRAYN